MIPTTEDEGNSCFPNFYPWLSVLVSKCEHLNKQKTAGQQTGYSLLEPTLRPGGEGCHAIHSIPSCQMTVASWLLLHQPVDSCQFASYQLQECSSSLTWTLVITGPRQQLLGQPTGWPRRNSTKSAGFTKDPLSCTRQATALYMPATWLIIKEAGNL